MSKAPQSLSTGKSGPGDGSRTKSTRDASSVSPSLVEQITTFWENNQKTRETEDGRSDALSQADKKPRDAALEKLMDVVASFLLECAGLTKEDRNECRRMIKSYVRENNKDALGFAQLIQAQDTYNLRLRLRSFSKIKDKDAIVDFLASSLNDRARLSGDRFLLWFQENPELLRFRQMKMPNDDEIGVFRTLVDFFHKSFHDSSENAAVMKVAAYNVFLQYVNPNLCSRYYPELSLFNLTSTESPAEVVAHVKDKQYRYFLTGRADGFVVSLMSETLNGRQPLVDSEYQQKLMQIYKAGEMPKYETLIRRLDKMIGESDPPLAYEILLIEVKKLQPAQSLLKEGLKQVVSECAAVEEYGPEKCRILKFILTDGKTWIYGILDNSHMSVEHPGVQRKCFYILLDDEGLLESDTGDILKVLAIWMTVPGNTLLQFFQPNGDGKHTDR